MTALQQQGQAAKAASYTLATAGTAQKNAALEAIASILTERQAEWLAANAEDVSAAKEAGMRPAMLDRLTLTPERVAGIVEGVRQVIALPDPIGTADKTETRPNGLIISRRRVPLGVVAIIFEARPNVTVDAAALCLKSGNVCILRGGKEAIRSNRAVTALMREALASAGLPEDCVSLVQDTSHETANELMHLDGYVDVLIPRGGAGLIRAVAKEASVPVIRTGEGVCHIYVDGEADLDMGAEILYNAKCSRPSVCNAVECVLVQEEVLESFLQKAVPLLERHRVEHGPGHGGGRRLHQRPRHPALREHHHHQLLQGPAVSGHGGRRSGVRQRLHPFHRRRRVRPGGGDRHLHPENARPGPHGPGGADQPQIRGLRHGADPVRGRSPRRAEPGRSRRPFFPVYS